MHPVRCGPDPRDSLNNLCLALKGQIPGEARSMIQMFHIANGLDVVDGKSNEHFQFVKLEYSDRQRLGI